MCNGQVDALPNTHGTLTATLIIQSSMSSIFLLAPPATTSVSRSTTSSSSSTTTTSSSGLLTMSGSPPPVNTAQTATYTAQATSMTATPAPAPRLSKSQIAGISVAAVGGSALTVGILILFICWRRKKARDDDDLPFQKDPNSFLMDGAKYPYRPVDPNARGPGGTANGIAAKVPPRVPQRMETPSPNMFSRRSIKPDVIGLAVSQPADISPGRMERRPSRLLPEKPTLKLKVLRPTDQPQSTLSFDFPQQPPPPQQAQPRESAVSRQSSATVFEEDYSATADDRERWRRPSNAQGEEISTAYWSTIRQVNPDPTSQAAYAVSGEDGYHWRPGRASNPSAGLPNYYVKTVTQNQGTVPSFSQPLRSPIHPQGFPLFQQHQPQPESQLAVPASQANRPITTSSSVYSRGSLPASDGGRISGAPKMLRSYKQAGPYDAADTGLSPIEPRTADLSPVVESPASGKSPVSYPKIPGRLSDSDIRRQPAPPQPDFTRGMGEERNVIAQVGMQKHKRTRSRENAEDLTTSTSFQNLSYQVPRAPEPVYRAYSPPLTDATGGFAPSSLLRAQNQNQDQNQNQSQYKPSITLTHPSRSASTITTLSHSSTSSSLLAKRRGSEKAAALTLMNGEEQQGEKKKKWKVLDASGQGKLMREIEERLRIGGGGEGSEAEFQREELPDTPGWVPKLTPTRKGDELFLSVQ
jgi:hypothetical protein